ncbi:MAG: hypothetical protein ACERKT_00145 [Acidobacteriota bacterium]
MSNPHQPDSEPTENLPPGADRFWGQFSQTRAGRSSSEDPGQDDPGRADRGDQHECLEWCPICRSADLLRATASPEIRQQLQSIQNEAFQILRAFAVAYAERTGADPFDGAGRHAGPDSSGPGRGGAGSGQPAADRNGGSGPDEPRVTDISIE